MRSVACSVVLGLCLVLAGGSAAAPFRTAVADPYAFEGADLATPFKLVHRAGASVVRLKVEWPGVAPGGTTRPVGFEATDPADSAYQWQTLDAQVKEAVAAGLAPILDVVGAPLWAERGTPVPDLGPVDPDPVALGQFATAIAKRYSGSFQGLPHVRYWQVWNEPNITPYLLPQFDGAQPVSPGLYRDLVNRFAAAVHQVQSTNVVVAGGLSPFTVDYGAVKSIGPLRFMRELLCISAGAHPHATCSQPVHFDVWAHHPYTSGDAFHHAANPDDVSMGDLPKMRALLTAAQRIHHIVAPRGLGFWITEMSWDTSPPDPKGVPLALQGRWTAEAMYQAWRSGVSLITWFMLQDQPYPASSYQSGLYFGGKKLGVASAKPTLAAFKFPFVAYLHGSTVAVWAHTPAGKPALIQIQQRSPRGGWAQVAAVRTNSDGILSKTLSIRASSTDSLRARLAGSTTSSLPFSLTRPPDRPVHPFG